MERGTIDRLAGMALWGAAAATVVAAVVLPSRVAQACGGLFCDRPPINPLDPLPVAQAGENVVFGVDGDPTQGTATVTAHIQVLYSGAAAQFSWVVPVAAVPELSTGTDRLFSALAGVTQPTYLPTRIVDGSCRPDPATNTADAGTGFTGAGGASAGAGGAGGVTVVFQGAVGPYDAVVLQSADSNELKGWLTDNGYYLDSRAGQIIDTYVQEGKYFVALKLTNGQDVRAIRPIVLTFHGTNPCVPLRLTAIAAFPDMPVTVYVLGAARAVPLGFLELKLDELRIDWLSAGSNYRALLSEAANEAGGNAFVTEYAGTAAIGASLLWAPGRFDEAALRAAETPPAYVQVLVNQGLANDPQMLPLLAKYIPMPAEAVARGIPQATFYGNLALYSTQFTFPPFDLAGLTGEIVAGIIEPRRLAQQMVDAHSYLTRFGTFISPEEMNQDPLFAFNADLPEVARAHTAVIRTMCGDQKFLACNAPVRLELPDGRMAWLRGGVDAPACAYAPYDGSLTVLPATEVVWKRTTVGEGTRRLDNIAMIQVGLNAHNAAYGPENRLFPLPGGSGGGGGGSGQTVDPGGVNTGSGCGCAVGGGAAASVTALAGAALALLALLRRARRGS